MVPRRSFASVRSSFFNQEIAEADYNHYTFGGRSLYDYTLEDFRPMWRKAHARAIEHQRAVNTVWNYETEQWEERSHNRSA